MISHGAIKFVSLFPVHQFPCNSLSATIKSTMIANTAYQAHGSYIVVVGFHFQGFSSFLCHSARQADGTMGVGRVLPRRPVFEYYPTETTWLNANCEIMVIAISSNRHIVRVLSALMRCSRQTSSAINPNHDCRPGVAYRIFASATTSSWTRLAKTVTNPFLSSCLHTHRVDLAALLALAPVHEGGEGVGGHAVLELVPGEGRVRAVGGVHPGGLQPQRLPVARVVDEHNLQRGRILY